MKKRFNPSLHPMFGYFFIEADGSTQRGRGWSEVIAKVGGYRQINGLPFGDPEEEVHAQAISREPTHAIEI